MRRLLSCPRPLHEACVDLTNTQEEVRRPHPVDSWRREVLPLWRTFQGLSALRAHAVWMYQPGT